MFFLFLSAVLSFGQYLEPTPVAIGEGREPEMTVDKTGTIRIIYGLNGKIFYARSSDHGKSFSEPVTVAEIPGMHLGMERGPQFATSSGYSLMTATDKQGNIHSMLLNHSTDKWETIGKVNDIDEIAKEGLMDLAADDKNNFYAVWLDLRINKRNNIGFSTYSRNSGWKKNRTIYTSPEGKVCECCRPSIAVNGKSVAVMFRNSVGGNRDLYLATSSDKGEHFSDARKLGEGTWKLEACPMDGGGVVFDGDAVRTIWQRENQVFAAEPGMPESKIANGRLPKLTSNGGRVIYTWNDGGSMFLKEPGKDAISLGQGIGMKPLFINHQEIGAVWEENNKINFKMLRP